MELNKDVVDTVNFLPEQLWESWEESRKVVLPDNYKNFKRILVAGMGGSALGGRVARSLYLQSSAVSIDVSTEYTLPAYADGETLLIATSYSGNTEETLATLRSAMDRNIPSFVMTTGGKLAELAQKHSLPAYIINPSLNPSKQPRLAVGYLLGGIFGVLARCKAISASEQEIQEVVDFLKSSKGELEEKGAAMAKAFFGKAPILVASEHLAGSAHVMKNQFNETAKTFSALFDIPELNHHLMEGLKNPASVTSGLVFAFFESSLYSDDVQKRYPLTREVVEKNNVSTYSLHLIGKNKLVQAFELISVGSWAQLHLGAMYGEDPTSIPWVDYFKERLA